MNQRDLQTAMEDYFEERSANMHHCGGLPKERAE